MNHPTRTGLASPEQHHPIELHAPSFATDESDNAPVFVSGLPRSGTTWMQCCLSQHPAIHIHGQFPRFGWPRFWDIYQSLKASSQWATNANLQLEYTPPHYAGSPPDRTIEVAKTLFKGYLTGFGPDTKIWGMRSLDNMLAPEACRQVEEFWPQARWIVCIRHPFLSIASLKNTFSPNLDLAAAARSWVQVCEFAGQHDPKRTITFQIDQLATPDQRERRVEQVLNVLGVEYSEETRRFARAGAVVHKVKPDVDRTFSLSVRQQQWLLETVDGLQEWLERMSYTAHLSDNDKA